MAKKRKSKAKKVAIANAEPKPTASQPHMPAAANSADAALSKLTGGR